MHDDIERYWHELAGIARTMPYHIIAEAAELLIECYQRGSTVFVMGNGGSAATASHFACDLSKGTQVPPLAAFRVMALTDNVPLLTAWGNDTNYDRVFAEQLRTLVRPGDVVVMISASGNSRNVLHVADVARSATAGTIAMTGASGGAVCELVDLTIKVPGGSIEQIEDAHAAVSHSLCVALRGRLRTLRDEQVCLGDAALLDSLVAEPLAL